MTPEYKYTLEDLKTMQEWPLERKIRVTQTRIIEFYQRLNGAVAVSISGGKDSAVLLDLARRCFPDIEAVFVDTGLEFPEVRKMAINTPNVTVLKPEKTFKEVIEEHGWCFPSKDMAAAIDGAKRGVKWGLNYLKGLNIDGTPSLYKQTRHMKWAFLIDAPFKISAKCCYFIKEKPLAKYHRASGKHPIIGIMAADSKRREQAFRRTGCNIFDSEKRKVSKPLSFWTQQDILKYIYVTELPIASIYGDVVKTTNLEGQESFFTTGEQHTGCMFCLVGCHLDKINRFQKMRWTHPKHHDFIINKLKAKEILTYLGINY